MPQDAAEDFEYESLPENSSLSASLLAGAFAGIAEHAIMYPVDSIKVHDKTLSKSLATTGESCMNRRHSTRGEILLSQDPKTIKRS